MKYKRYQILDVLKKVCKTTMGSRLIIAKIAENSFSVIQIINKQGVIKLGS